MMRQTIMAILATAALLNGVRGEPANLMRNGGFEQGDEMPGGWTFAWKATHSNDRQRGIEKQEPDWGWDTETRRGGRRSVRIGVERPVDDGVWTQDDVPVVPGTKIYLLRVWVKSLALNKTDFRVGCISMGAEGKWLAANYTVVRVTEDGDWCQCTGLFEPHPEAESFRVRLWLNMGYSGTGTVWVDDVELVPTDLTEAPPILYVDDAQMPAPDSEDEKAGFMVFQRHWLDMVFPTSVPRQTEITDAVRLTATPGEREPVTFSLRSLKDLGTVTVSSGDLVSDTGSIPADRVRVNPVRCLVRGGQARWGPYRDSDMLVPVIVEETDQCIVPDGTTQRLWVTVHVPDDTPAGDYRGAVTLSAAHGGTRKVGLTVTVLPLKLLTPPHIYHGMYTRFRDDPEFLSKAYEDMWEHGMSTIGLCANLGAEITLTDGRATLKLDGTSDLEKAMTAYIDAGFTRPVLWLMGRDVIHAALTRGPLESPTFERAYRQCIEAVLARGRELGWPEIIFQPVDEPFEHARRKLKRKDPDSPTLLETARRCLQILKSVPGVRTEEDGFNGAPETLEALDEWCDVQCIHDGPVLRRGTYDAAAWQGYRDRMEREGREVWFYNTDITGFHPEPLRFGYGFGLYQAGATGALNWSYMTAYRADKPDGLYTRKLPMAHRYNPAPGHPGGPTTAWEAAREGVDDYRYLYTFLETVRQVRKVGVPKSVRLAEQAENEVKDCLAAIDFNGCTGTACQGRWTGETGLLPSGQRVVSGQYKMANRLEFGDYDALRQRLATWIVRLGDARAH